MMMTDFNFLLAVYEKVGGHLLEELEINAVIDEVQKILQLEPENYLKICQITADQFISLTSIVPALSKVEYHHIELYYECFSK